LVWWLLPIFCGWLGGLIAWIMIKKVNPQKAIVLLVTGILRDFILLIVYMVPFMNALSHD
jgi:hypothetical protein